MNHEYNIPKGSGTVSVASLSRNIRDLTTIQQRSTGPHRLAIKVDGGQFCWTDWKGSFQLPVASIESLRTTDVKHGPTRYRALTMTFANNGVPRSYQLLTVPMKDEDWLQSVNNDLASELGVPS